MIANLSQRNKKFFTIINIFVSNDACIETSGTKKIMNIMVIILVIFLF